jgi:hypothetical protein
LEISSLIQRFFQQQCNAEEVDYLLKYFDENPGVLNEYLSEDEWQGFLTNKSLPQNISSEMWKNIHLQTKSKNSIVFYMKRFAVAASFLLATFFTWTFINSDKSNKIDSSNTRISFQKTTVNNTSKELCFYLNDGSFVKLMPQSSLTYPDTFINKTRDLTLKGEAVFNVAQNPNKPFTVYSDAIATTAIGTIFTVKSFAKDNTIQVILREGKVVIKPTHANSFLKESYLLAGEIFTYSKTSNTVILSNPKNKFANNQLNNQQKFSINDTELGNNWYMFNNQSLAETFDQLSLIYGVKIEYNKFQLRGMTFIGKIDKSDSLQNILNSIALLNKLKVQKNEQGYFIKK